MINKKQAKAMNAVIIISFVVGISMGLISFKTNRLIEAPVVIKDIKPATVRDGGETIHPVSLPALMTKEFHGGGLELREVLDDSSAYTKYFVTYKSEPVSPEGGGLSISGVMLVPKEEPPATGFPVIFTNHGYIDPVIYTNGRGLKREYDYLARNGYVVFHSDYRNHAQSDKEPDQELRYRLGYVEDMINAVLAVQSSGLSYINKEKIGMLGHSMGGGVTINILVARPDLVDAAVLYAPVSADARDNFDKWTTDRPEVADKIIELYGGPELNPIFWDNLSAITFIEKIKTPIINHHGTADDAVPFEWSERLQAELEIRGKDSILYTYPDGLHEFIGEWPLFMERNLEFFDRHLKGKF
ncbi:MAG: alpha/beta fold hydrolase [bacterium]|nr:alpha/beta fold hydrolase [bacterium]